MNGKEYLSQAIWIDKIINNKLEQKVRLEALAEKTTSSYSKDKVSGGKSIRSQMEETIVKIIDLEYEINETIDWLVDLKKEIMDTINQLSELSYTLILEMRYINNKSWDDVAEAMGYDKRWVMRLHGRALKEIDEIIKKATKSHRKPPSKCGNI